MLRVDVDVGIVRGKIFGGRIVRDVTQLVGVVGQVADSVFVMAGMPYFA